jgi:tetratricopeptide (TPR) repeat protein
MRSRLAALLTLVLLALAGPAVRGDDSLSGGPEELLGQGNALFEEGRFEEAVEVYRMALAYGIQSEILHYNLGNALFRTGRLGPAILEYERALLLSPGDEDIRANLAFARSQAADAPPEEEESPWALLADWLRKPGVNGAALAGLVAYLVAAAALAAALLRRGRWGTRRLLALSAAGLLLALPPALVVAVQGSEREWDERAVLLVPRAEARSGPAESNPLLFTVHEGTTVTILDQREGWTRISLPDGLNGWVPTGSIEAIRR